MAEEIVTDSKKSYGQILKTTAVFGSIKVFSLVVGFLKAKIIAVFLGPAGMGVFNLLNYPISLFTQFSSLGISTSGIREVAQAEDQKQLSITAEVIKYWNRTLGFIGALVLFCLAPYISKLSFGDDSFSWAFRILAIVVLLNNIGSEYEVLLRGCRKTKLIAKAGFFSNLAGFIVSIPFYFFYGTSGIVAVILITSLTLVSVNCYYAKKLDIQPIKLALSEIFKKGQSMASIGFFIVLGDLIFVGAITVVNSFVRIRGGVEDVGLFQACLQLTQSSINVVLVAMAADYYPRLSGLQGKFNEISIVASQQTEIAVLLCVPVISTLIIFAPIVIRILLSVDFLCIQDAICWFLLGAIFKLPSWAMNFVVLANGKTKLYVTLVLANNIVLLPLYCIGYYIGGISGMGISYILLSIIYSIMQNSVIYNKFGVRFTPAFWKTYALGVMISVTSMFLLIDIEFVYKIILGFVILFSAYCYSLCNLEKKTQFMTSIKNKFHTNRI